MTDTERRLQLAHQARRAKEHQLDDIRRALCDVGVMRDDDPYSHADLADVIRQTAAEPTTAPRGGLSSPLKASQGSGGAQGAGGRDGASGGRTADPDRAELCRQFKAALTRRWDVAPFVIDEIVDDAVDLHLDLTGRDASALARVRALCDDADRRGVTSGPPLTADRIRAALAPQAGDDTTGDTP